jgi:uncharacterized cofD-like protein
MKKNVVVVGGGNGAAVSILALKRNPDLFSLSAIIAMSDSGGSSGRLRKEFGTLPPGDILRAILAMSKYDYYTLRQIFYERRYTGGKLDRHNLGNIFMTLATMYSGSLVETLEALQHSLECVGNVYPMTLESADLYAVLKNGDIKKSETEIDRPGRKSDKTVIEKVWLEPQPTLYPDAKKALLKADYIVLGPGSLYTSIVPSLLVKGFVEALKKSKAKLVYIVGNGYEKEGENGSTTMAGFVTNLQGYLPRPLDMVIYNTEDLGNKEKRFYADKKWAVAARDVETLGKKYQLVGHRFERDGGGLSKEKLAEAFKMYLK